MHGLDIHAAAGAVQKFERDLGYDLRRRDRQQRRLDSVHINLRVRERSRKYLRIRGRGGVRIAQLIAQHGDQRSGSDTGRVASPGQCGAARGRHQSRIGR